MAILSLWKEWPILMKLLSYIFVLTCLNSFVEIPKNYLKKIDKEILITFDIPSYDMERVEISEEVLDKMSVNFDPEGFYKITQEEADLGYFYFGKAPSKADEFDFIVIFDKDMIIKKIKILAYREDYGGEISSKRWLRQFDGISTKTRLKYGSDIMGISGATISAQSMTNAVNDLLTNLSILAQ